MQIARRVRGLVLILGLALVSQAVAHDIWIETTETMVKPEQRLDLFLKVGNHGNHHRDFAVIGKLRKGQQNVSVLNPDGKSVDLTSGLAERGGESNESSLAISYVAKSVGVYQAMSTFDQVMSYAPVRDIKCAKTYFSVEGESDQASYKAKPTGAPFEIIPITDPVAQVRVGREFKVQLFFHGKPLANNLISFIPKGVELKGEIDPRFEVRTDANGVALLRLERSGQWLVASHLQDKSAKGTGYESINYSATIHLLVPKNKAE